MNPTRKRPIRLVVGLSAAVVLASALMYTSFAAGHPEIGAGDLLVRAQAGRTYQLAGTVVAARRNGDLLVFRIRDPKRARVSALVRYRGAVPDPFRVGRGVIVTVRPAGHGVFVGQRDSLITKCPSMFTAAPPGT